jgi:osmotically-inducible protein OsmY
MKSDKQLHVDVAEELQFEPSLDEREIGISVANGVVNLSGRVSSYAQRVAAIRAVERVDGVVGVANELVVEPLKAFTRSDVDIAEAAARALLWSSSVPGNMVQVEVQSGWVTIRGTLEWEYQRKAAEEIVRNLVGVRGITNHIALSPPTSPKDVAREIVRAFHRRAGLHATEVKVSAADHTVTLSGRVHSWSERQEAEEAAWGAPGVAVVRNELAVVA